MKRNLLMISMTAALFFANASHAEQAFNLDDSTTCKDVTGRWVGEATGRMIFDNAIQKCIYEGHAVVSNMDSAGNFSVKVTGLNTSGGWFCPLSFNDEVLTGSCNNNIFTINTILGTIKGSVLNGEGSAKGHLTFPAMPPFDKVKVSVRFSHTQ